MCFGGIKQKGENAREDGRTEQTSTEELEKLYGRPRKMRLQRDNRGIPREQIYMFSVHCIHGGTGIQL